MKNTEKIMRIVVRQVALLVVLVALGMNCFYTLDTEHAAVVTTFGKPETVNTAGVHLMIPLVQKVKQVNTTIRGLAIGYDVYSGQSIEEESVMITSDYNFINVDFYVEYQVSDPVKMLYNSNSPEQILKSVTQNCIRTTIASYPVDTVLTTGKSEIQSNVKSMLIDKMNELDIGITVRNVTIQDSEPPTAEVNAAFKAVETAKQNKETQINEANQYRNEQIPAAKAQVDRILQDAEAKKVERIAEAEGQVARFNAMYDEYVKYPEVTKQRMFYETMEDVLPNLKVVIESANGSSNTILPLDEFVGTVEENKNE